MTSNKESLFSTETKRGRALNLLIFPVLIVILMVILNIITSGQMLTGANLSIVISNFVTNALIAWALSFVWSSGPDFSAGAIIMVSAFAGTEFGLRTGLGIFGIVVGAIISAVILQLVSTLIRDLSRLPAWIAGLAMCLIYESFIVMYSSFCTNNGLATAHLPVGTMNELTTMPGIAIVLVIAFIAAYILHERTKLGTDYKAVCCSAQISSYAGIKSKKTIYLGVMVGAVYLGLAAAMQMLASKTLTIISNLGSITYMSTGLCCWLLSAGIARRMPEPVAILLSSFTVAYVFNFMAKVGVEQGTWSKFILGVSIVVFLIISYRNVKGVVK